MTTTRNELTKNEERSTLTTKMLNDVLVAGCATAISQVTRMLSTYSCLYTSPVQTIKCAFPNLLNGLHINIGRGSMATGLQIFAKDIGYNMGGFGCGLAAAAFSGAGVATLLETALTRKSLNAKSFFYFSPALSNMYFIRELAFSTAVLVKGNLTSLQQDVLLIASAMMTAGLQKFITVEAGRDTLQPGVTAPDFKQGVKKTLIAMSKGEYSHRAFQVPFPAPTGNLAKALNVAYQLSGGPNAIAFRILHLLFFREMLKFSANNLSLNNLNVLFNKQRTKKIEKHIKKEISANRTNCNKS